MCQNVTKSRLSLFCFVKIAGPLIKLGFLLHFISGMAAVNVVIETLQSGDHVVASNQVIKGLNFFFRSKSKVASVLYLNKREPTHNALENGP